MSTIKVKYKSKKLYSYLFFGVLWIFLAIAYLYNQNTSDWLFYVNLVLGLAYLGLFTYGLIVPYLTIENGYLKKNYSKHLGKKVKLQDVVWIKKFGDSYTLITTDNKLNYQTNWIDNASIELLHDELGKLNLSSDKTPFHKG
jgi:hypothetical protein